LLKVGNLIHSSFYQSSPSFLPHIHPFSCIVFQSMRCHVPCFLEMIYLQRILVGLSILTTVAIKSLE
jgi:hypothetical protein